MKRLLLASFLALVTPAAAYAQVDHAQVVAACGTVPTAYPVGWPQPLTMDVNGNFCTNSSGGGGGSVTQGTIPWVVSGAAGAALGLNSTLSTINTTLGTPFQAGGSIGNTTFAVTQGTSPWVVSGTVTATAASSQASATARGGTITAGGTSQTLITSNGSRKAFTVVNPCSAAEQGIGAAENAYINLTSAATVNTSANLTVLAPCSSFSMGLTAGVVSTEAVTAIAATTGHILYAKEF